MVLPNNPRLYSMSNLAQHQTFGALGGKSDVDAVVWPNGEAAVWKVRTKKLQPLVREPLRRNVDRKMAIFRLASTDRSFLRSVAPLLGLSLLPIFDILDNAGETAVQTARKIRVKKGQAGITSFGKRMVRNAAHLLEVRHGRVRCVFATVTVPELPIEQMRALHEKWGEVVERYRLGIRRLLQDKGLSGEIVTVSEVQEKRYERTGVPVLHLHSVFCGVDAQGQWAISTEAHDNVWVNALRVAIDIERDICTNACNLQRVKKSASGYLAKYLSKGSKVVNAIKDSGYGRWLPKHWWNCTRSLSRRVKSQTRRVQHLANWLDAMAYSGCKHCWKWHRIVTVESKDGTLIQVARYGQLTEVLTAQIQAYYDVERCLSNFECKT